jgi:hypothetical protein
MLPLALVCVVVSLVLLALAAFSVPSGRFSLLAAGVFFYVLSTVV